jgi:hypothetical protein
MERGSLEISGGDMMDRKEFLKAAGLASGCMLLFKEGGMASGLCPAKITQEGEAMRKAFFERWITSLMENLEEHLDPAELKGLMEDCGRDCARHSSVHSMAESCKGDVDKFVGTMAKFLGKENCYREGQTVHLKYPKCYCELVDRGPEKLPGSYCLCSRGWVVEMFGAAAGKPVEVEILKSIKRGDAHCEFSVAL